MCAEPCTPPARHPRQRGSLLLELMVVAVLATLLVVWASQTWAQRIRVLQAQALAAWMLPARDAAQALLVHHGAQLQQAEAPDAMGEYGIADWRSPQWTELQALGLLAPGWQKSGPLRQQLDLQIQRSDSCPQAPCRLQALVLAQPGLLRTEGGMDAFLVAEWLQATQGRGLVVWPQALQQLRGAGRMINLPPSSRWGPGTVALQAELTLAQDTVGDPDSESGPQVDPVDHSEFLRVRDSRNPDFQGAVSARGLVRSDTWLQGQEGLLLVKGVASGGVCATEGGIGRQGVRPGLLVCHQGRWQQLAGPAGGGYLLSSKYGCAGKLSNFTGNPLTGACSCGAGYQAIQVSESGDMAHVDGLSRGYICIPGS
ncbi:hypothetical protein [Castellaniella sp.]|nr:hypothetical protein [Castellaniella sp.]